MSRASSYRILVALETDATRYHGSGARRPRLLQAGDTAQLLAHVATDLEALLPGLADCWLSAPGALLDQTQVLRPGYPAFRALEAIALEQNKGRAGARLGVPARDGRIDPGELQPLPGIPLGILQILPVLLCGPPDAISRLGAEMEHRFLEKGQVSAHTARWLESAFGIEVHHARFMTLTDLNAMFRLQLENFGFLPLWTLIDAALNERRRPLEVSTGDGQSFTWQGRAVRAAFQTFDYWASHGLGSRIESARGNLAGEYANWTRQLRQFLTTIVAHGIPVEFHLPGDPDHRLGGTYFVETGRHEPPPDSASITEHSFSELGAICITGVQGGRLKHYYPLSAAGLNDIHRALRDLGTGAGTVAYPGSILYDPNTRTLVPDRDAPSTPRRRVS